MNTLNPLEYVSILRRRKKVFFLVAGIIFSLSVVYALKWSNYRAAATVEVVQPEIAIDVAETSGVNAETVEAIADLRIGRLRQKVLSTSSLVDVIAKLNLYPGVRKHTPISYVARQMQKKITIKLLSTPLANPASAQKASTSQLSAIAFVLSFEYGDPLLAQQTVNELVSRFLDEDLKDRRNTAKSTSDFLDGQIEILSESLAEQERKIAEFRAENGNIRPDALSFNQQAAASSTSRLQAIESQIISNIGLQGALRSQLAQTDPYSTIVENGQALTTPSTQLRALKSQYATLTAKYGQQHPDVLKVSRQIDALESQVDPASYTARIKAKITDIQTRLDTTRETYGEEHPDVISLQNQLEKLKEQLSKAGKGKSRSSFAVKKDADNPAYLQIAAQLQAAQEQQKALLAQKEEVRREQEEYQLAISENPAMERQFAALTRDYDNSLILYRELKARKLASNMNEAIEETHNGRRLAVIDAPELPRTTQPARSVFILAGFILALTGGLASVLTLHILSRSIIGPQHLETLVGVAPLVTIPHLRTLDEKISIKHLLFKILIGALMLTVAGFLIFSVMVMPFDLFRGLLMQRIGF